MSGEEGARWGVTGIEACLELRSHRKWEAVFILPSVAGWLRILPDRLFIVVV